MRQLLHPIKMLHDDEIALGLISIDDFAFDAAGIPKWHGLEQVTAIAPNTQSQKFVGSGASGAPEIFEQEAGAYCMKKADIYALGPLGLKLMFGYHPEECNENGQLRCEA